MKFNAHVLASIRARTNWLPLHPIDSWVSLHDDNGHTHCSCCGLKIRSGDRCVGRYFEYTSITFCLTCVADNPDKMRGWVKGPNCPRTKTDWAYSSDPTWMMSYLVGRVSDRRLRLFACACARRIWDRLPDFRNRDLVVAVENHPEGSYDDPRLHSAVLSSAACEGEVGRNPTYWPAKYLGQSFDKLSAVAGATLVALKVRRIADLQAEAAVQAAFLRDIFGNPFRPVTFDPWWLSSAVMSMARGIYDEKAFDRHPILADALADAGCSNDELLDHLRGPGPHVRGCWVVDLLLGKK